MLESLIMLALHKWILYWYFKKYIYKLCIWDTKTIVIVMSIYIWSMHVMCFHPNGAYQNNKWKLVVHIKQTILSKIQMMEQPKWIISKYEHIMFQMNF